MRPESGLIRIGLCLCRAALGLCDLIDNAGEVGDGRLHAAEESAQQFLSGGNGCDHLSSLGIIVSSLNYGSLQLQLVRSLCEVCQHSCGSSSIFLGYCQCGRSFQMGIQRRKVGSFCCPADQGVLIYLVGNAGFS